MRRRRTGRSALACLCLLLPVQEFRAAWGRVPPAGHSIARGDGDESVMKISRADRSIVTEWWFTVDRMLLAAILLLAGSGLVLSLAASPAVALKKGLHAFHFVERHAAFSVIGICIMLAVSMMQARMIRRLSLIVFLAALVLMVCVLIFGDEINGARRWLRLGGFSLQPSEFAKPAFIVLSAWAFSETQKQIDMPARSIAVGLLLVLVALLLQPDVGQTFLAGAIWATLFVLSGQPLVWAGVFAAIGILARWRLHDAGLRAVACRPLSGIWRRRIFPDGARPAILRSGSSDAAPVRHDQDGLARCSHGLHLRGDRRGVRRRGLPGARRNVRDHRLARLLSNVYGARPFARLAVSGLSLLFDFRLPSTWV